MLSLKTMGFYVSSSNSAQCFCCSYNHLKVKIVMYTFQTLLHWKRGFPQVQFLFNIDMAKKPITWMTIIRITKSTLW